MSSGAPPSESLEEAGAVEGVPEREQSQGIPAGGCQLAALQLVQQVSDVLY